MSSSSGYPRTRILFGSICVIAVGHAADRFVSAPGAGCRVLARLCTFFREVCRVFAARGGRRGVARRFGMARLLDQQRGHYTRVQPSRRGRRPIRMRQKSATVVVIAAVLVGTGRLGAAQSSSVPHPDINLFFTAVAQDESEAEKALDVIAAGWRSGYAGMIVELVRFLEPPRP